MDCYFTLIFYPGGMLYSYSGHFGNRMRLFPVFF